MEESGNQRARRQVVVDLDRFAGLGQVYRDGTLLQAAARIWVNLQLLVRGLGEYDGGRRAGRA
jgi:hypothetical protein